MLQIFGGAAEQGYYSLGFNLGAICFLITGSFTPLLMREYAIAHEQKKSDRLALLFSKYLPLFYVITAAIACFFSIHGDWLAPLIGLLVVSGEIPLDDSFIGIAKAKAEVVINPYILFSCV